MRHHRPWRRRAPLHRRLFVWFGLSILVTGLTVGIIVRLIPGESWRSTQRGMERLASRQFAVVWQEPTRRADLARRLAADLGVDVTLLGIGGERLESFGAACERPDFRAAVRDASDDRVLGHVHVCGVWRRHGGGHGFVPFVVLGALIAALWAASAVIARRIAKPLRQLTRVTEDLGGGRLSSRVRLNPHWPGELGQLAESINDMATRIERQIAEQRELLATVSHEIRSPLARVRVLLELGRERAVTAELLTQMEQEVVEIDALVGELLAKSRLDFAALDVKALDALELARRALERAGADRALLECDAPVIELQGDPTLLVRALLNLLENAERHAGGFTRLVVTHDADQVSFSVEDAGPGFRDADLPRVFESFVRGAGDGESTLGLGLSLVQRIATAHGGRAWAENLAQGGARVGITIARRGA